MDVTYRELTDPEKVVGALDRIVGFLGLPPRAPHKTLNLVLIVRFLELPLIGEILSPEGRLWRADDFKPIISKKQNTSPPWKSIENWEQVRGWVRQAAGQRNLLQNMYGFP